MQNTHGDRFGNRIGPIERIDVPHDGSQSLRGYLLENRPIAGAIGSAEQLELLAGYFFQEFRGVVNLFEAGGFGELWEHRVRKTVIRQDVPCSRNFLRDLTGARQLRFSGGIHRSEIRTQLEEARADAVFPQERENLFGVLWMRAVIETQGD